MATKVTLEDKDTPLVRLSSLNIGSPFRWSNKLYLKLREGRSVRIKGDSTFHDFESTTLDNNTLVEPLDVEIKFSVQ